MDLAVNKIFSIYLFYFILFIYFILFYFIYFIIYLLLYITQYFHAHVNISKFFKKVDDTFPFATRGVKLSWGVQKKKRKGKKK